jgi:hypothetical protein
VRNPIHAPATAFKNPGPAPGFLLLHPGRGAAAPTRKELSLRPGAFSGQRTVDWRLKFERIRQFDSLASAEKRVYYP